MPLKKLALPALVVPTNPDWKPQALGAGSLVDIVEDHGWTSRLSLPDEILINWRDVAGRVSPGWLARTTTFSANGVKRGEPTNERGELTLSAYDLLREQLVCANKTKAPWPLLDWLARFGEQQAELVQKIIRQLGGVPPRDSVNDTIVRAARLITQQEVTMFDVQESAGNTATKPATKRAVKKGSAKKTTAKKTAKRAVSAEAPARSMARTVGNTLIPLLEKAGAKRDCISIAKHLANDESVTKKQLTELRDTINELASEARANNKESLASSLSGANRLVRRLSRKA